MRAWAMLASTSHSNNRRSTGSEVVYRRARSSSALTKRPPHKAVLASRLVVDRGRHESTDLLLAARTQLNARLGAQALREQLDEGHGRRVVELVASLVGGQPEVV